MGDPLITHPCPGGYCRCFVISLTGPQTCAFAFSDSSPDQQCICDREGEGGGGRRSLVSTDKNLRHSAPLEMPFPMKVQIELLTCNIAPPLKAVHLPIAKI